MSKVYTVYVLETKDGKRYVGATSQRLEKRWNRGNAYRCYPEFWGVIARDGWDSIKKTVVGEGLSEETASRVEKETIAKFNSSDDRFGYNRDLGGLSTARTISEKSRLKNRMSQLGPLNHNYGMHFTEEHRRKISESNKGNRRSAETRARNGKAHEIAVKQFSTNGELIAVWSSGKKAASATGTQAGHISKVCKNQRATAGGYIWAYAN